MNNYNTKIRQPHLSVKLILKNSSYNLSAIAIKFLNHGETDVDIKIISENGLAAVVSNSVCQLESKSVQYLFPYVIPTAPPARKL